MPDELLAHRMKEVEQMREYIRADSLAFVSMNGLYRATGETGRNDRNPQFCDACFSGEYPDRSDGCRTADAAAASFPFSPKSRELARVMIDSKSGRVALVTGASRGIGRAAAKALAATGAHVILVARTVGGLEELDDEIQRAGGTATLVPLDLKDFPALDRLGSSIHERWGKLDAFLGNAGTLGELTPLSNLEPKVFHELIDINVTANWRLIRSLDPLLRASDAGRALFLTSGAARHHTPFWGGYAMSKAALESLVLTYAAECKGTNVRVESAQPRSAAYKNACESDAGRRPGVVATARSGGRADRRIVVARLREAGGTCCVQVVCAARAPIRLAALGTFPRKGGRSEKRQSANLFLKLPPLRGKVAHGVSRVTNGGPPNSNFHS